jgi:HlyD family secretion protein
MKPDKVPDWRRPAALGYGLIAFTFGVLGTWSAVAKIDSAAVAPGVIAMESNRKTVQHLEGGIVSEILVREGEHVNEGQVLFRLDTTQAQANLEVQRNQLETNMAVEARLIAERGGKDSIVFPEELNRRSTDPFFSNVLADQRNQFEERRASLDGQIDILKKKTDEYRREIEGLKREQTATESQLQFIDQELADLHLLLDRNLVQKSRVLQQEREKSRLAGIIGRSIADQSKAEEGINEATLQMRQLHQKFLEDVSASMAEVRQKIGDLREKAAVAKDVVRRTDIVAPKSGVVQNLKVFTIAGVIKAGEPLLDIVPEQDSMIVQAHVSPMEIEYIRPGMEAEIRLQSFQARRLPILSGHVQSVSRDRLVDEQTRQPYFLAQVVVSNDKLPTEVREHLTAGMPAEVILPTGERTVLNYILIPLKDRMSGAMREK